MAGRKKILGGRPVIIGRQEPVELATERTWNPKTGWRSSRKWKGSQDRIIPLATQIQREVGAYVTMTITPEDGGIATLVLNQDNIGDFEKPEAKPNGEPEADSDTWEAVANDLNKSIWNSPALVNHAANYPLDNAWLRETLPVIKKNGTWQDILNVWNNTNWQNSSLTQELFLLFRNGVEEFSISQFVLRRQRTIKSIAQGVISVSNVGKQFSLGQLQYYEGLPTVLNFALPTSGSWLKRSPQVSFTLNKTTVSGEFWHSDSWTEILYPTI